MREKEILRKFKIGDLVKWTSRTSNETNDPNRNHYALITKISVGTEPRINTIFTGHWVEVVFIGNENDIHNRPGNTFIWLISQYKRRRNKDRCKQNWYWEKV